MIPVTPSNMKWRLTGMFDLSLYGSRLNRSRSDRCGLLYRCGFRFLRGCKDSVEGCAFHAGHKLDQAGIADVEDEAVNDLVTQVAVGHLAALKAERSLHLVAFAEEADCLIFLGLVVVLVDGDRELDLFDGDDLLFLAGGAVAFVLLVEEFAVVLNLADGRNGVGGDLYEVERTLAGHLEGFEGSHDAELFAVLVDDADFACADTFVGADERLCGTFIDRWNKSPPQRALRLAMRLYRVRRTFDIKGCVAT